MKRKATPSHHKWKRKFFASILMCLCFGTLVLLMHTHYSRIMTLASIRPHQLMIQRPKIAFLFIARNRLPLDMLWDAFFQVIADFYWTQLHLFCDWRVGIDMKDSIFNGCRVGRVSFQFMCTLGLGFCSIRSPPDRVISWIVKSMIVYRWDSYFLTWILHLEM